MATNGHDKGNGKANGKSVAAEPKTPTLKVVGQFVRDLSFENITVRKQITGEVTPEIGIQVNLDLKKRDAKNQYEVATKYQVTSKDKKSGETLYILELEYCGVFHVENVPEDQLRPFLLIECPRLLFPYVRRIVADLIREGGFPPLNMEVVDFGALYREMVRQQAAKAREKQPAR